MISAIFFGVLSAVLWGTSDFLSRETSKSIGFFPTTCYIQFLGFLVPLALIPFYLGQNPVVDLRLFSLNFSLGVFVFLSFIFLYRGLSEGTMSIVAPVTSGTGPAFTVILAVVLLGQILSRIEAITITAVIIGVALSGVKFSQLKSDILAAGFLGTKTPEVRSSEPNGKIENLEHEKARRIEKGLDSSLLCAGCAAVVYLGLGIITPRLGWLVPALIMKGAAALTAATFLLIARRKIKIPDKRTFLLLVLMAALDAGGLLVFNFGIVVAEGFLPLVVTFSGLSGLVILLCARVAYQEKLESVQAVGIFLVITAASILLYFQ
ncbi:MAG TPA: DMT family transporter [Candidatus Saccharimonadales bacterium]|nr:DMT family transporter [Candidatus Saccharimonadales bacterium]